MIAISKIRDAPQVKLQGVIIAEEAVKSGSRPKVHTVLVPVEEKGKSHYVEGVVKIY